jgi:alkylhydroperoxidase family enzyme
VIAAGPRRAIINVEAVTCGELRIGGHRCYRLNTGVALVVAVPRAHTLPNRALILPRTDYVSHTQKTTSMAAALNLLTSSAKPSCEVDAHVFIRQSSRQPRKLWEGKILVEQMFSNSGAEYNSPAECNPQLNEAEDEASWAAMRKAVHERKRKLSAPEATAARLDMSAESHDRIAAMYDNIAERTSDADNCRQCATRHRAFASEDRQRAAQLRHLVTRYAASDPQNPPE